MTRTSLALWTALLCLPAGAAEVTVKNDSLTDGSSGSIIAGFVIDEAAAAWLTSPCNGTIRAVQVYWRSASGGSAFVIQDAVTVYRAGTFPTPGAVAAQIVGPQLTDSVMNEYRYLDENNTIPLSVTVSQDEVFVVSLSFMEAPLPSGPSVVRDTDGIQAGRNALLAKLPNNTLVWFNSADLGLTGDWVIRAVVDCPVGPQNADVQTAVQASSPLYSPGAALSYTVTVSNAGPAASANTSVVDIFPVAYTASAWTCTATGGASCTSGGSGNITQIVNLPSGGQVVYAVSGTVAVGTTGMLANAATAIVGSPATDPLPLNNTMTLQLGPESDRIFANGFSL